MPDFYRYYIEFVVTRGARFAGDIALDDISLSPECFGFRKCNCSFLCTIVKNVKGFKIKYDSHSLGKSAIIHGFLTLFLTRGK